MPEMIMPPEPFKLERFFAKYEFAVRHMMGCSDCEPCSVGRLLSLAGIESMGEFSDLSLGYTESPGKPSLREAVSSLYESIQGDQVLIAAPEECIFLFMMSRLPPGSHVIVMAPAYQSLISLPRSIGCEVTLFPVTEREDGWTLDMDDLKKKIKNNTECIILNTPHNPTGLVLDREMRRILIDLARENGITVFCDEMYHFLEYEGPGDTPSLCDEYENAVCLSGLSKAYGLPGLRIGWLVSRNTSLIREPAKFKDYTTICNSAPGEFLAEIALKHREKLIKKNIAIVKDNLIKVRDLFARHPETLILKNGSGGSTILPRFRSGISADDVSGSLAEKRGVLMVPGSLFDMPEEYFRIGLGRRDLAAALEGFDGFLEEMEHGKS